MAKTIDILFDDFVQQPATSEPTVAFTRLYDYVAEGKAVSVQNKIYNLCGEYELAVEQHAFKAGFYAAIDLLTNK